MSVISDWRAALFSIIFFIMSYFFMYVSWKGGEKRLDSEMISAFFTASIFTFVSAVFFFFSGFSK